MNSNNLTKTFNNIVLFANKKLNNLEFFPDTEILTFRGYRKLVKILRKINFEVSGEDWNRILKLYENFDNYAFSTKSYFEKLEKEWSNSLLKDKENEYKIFDFEVLEVLRHKKEELEKEFILFKKTCEWEHYRSINRFKNIEMSTFYANLLENVDINDFLEYRKICHSIKICEMNLGMRKRRDLDIEGVKRISIIKLFENNGIKVKRGLCKCPFHPDNTPSCKLYEETQSFYCFGCGEGGSTIDFVMKYLNMEFVDAVKHLQTLDN